MLNHLKWRASCYSKWQREKRKRAISLLMWHSHRTRGVQPAGQLAADGHSVQLLITQEPWLGRKRLLTASCKEFCSPQDRVGVCIREGSCSNVLSASLCHAFQGTRSYSGTCSCLASAPAVVQRLKTAVLRLADRNKIPLRSALQGSAQLHVLSVSLLYF